MFYDLGCGVGKLCTLAVQEFDVRKAVGIESHKGRVRKANERVRRLGLEDRVEIRNEDFFESDLKDATVTYYGLTEIDDDLPYFESHLTQGCRLVTLALPLVGVLPSGADYPFYLMKTPFQKTRDPSAWIEKVLFHKASIDGFYDELDNDYHYAYDKRAFKRMMRERFEG